jgi:hypothetical protein
MTLAERLFENCRLWTHIPEKFVQGAAMRNDWPQRSSHLHYFSFFLL